VANIRNISKLKDSCLRNAKKLLMEANRSLKRRNYPLSTFLAITSFEESLKYGLLCMLSSNYLTEKNFDSIWKDHVKKLRTVNSIIRFNLDDEENPKLVFGSKVEAIEIFNIRNDCLYVDVKNGLIKNPIEIGIDKATRFINDASRELTSAMTIRLLEKKIKTHFKKKTIKQNS